MSDVARSEDDALPLSLAQRVDAVCFRFEQAWQAGPRPRIEDYRGELPEAERPPLLRELVALEIDLRRRQGETVAVAEYQARFPQLDPHWLADLLPPHDTPTAPPLTGQVRRIRCPHCHNPITLVEDQFDEVLCPGCGSSFRLREARHTDTTTGTRPLGKYQLLERVGLGAFGAVWKARDSELDKLVALKIPHTGLLTEAGELERFHREARAAAQLRHPGIVTVHDVKTLEGLPTIVSDFITGAPLRALLEVRRLTFRESAALLAEVAEAVHYAHTLGVVHRDLKPANIMIEYGQGSEPGVSTPGLGRPLVMDFGLALRSEAEVTMTLDGHIIGTPAYMSPEQAAGKGHQADARSDVYSLGVILYELLTGELPFRGAKAMLLVQVLHDEPRPPRRLNDKIPRDLETICQKCLAKEPRRRYQSVRELADDLWRWLKGEAIRARPIRTWERLLLWVKRRPTLAALLLMSLVAAMALSGLVVGWRYHGQLETALGQVHEALAAATTAREQADQARRAEARERQRAEKALELASALLAVGELRTTRTKRYPTLAPFARVRWRDSVPEIQVEGVWYELLALNDLESQTIMAFCQKTYGSLWQRVFEVDLVEVLSRMGHEPGSTVELKVRQHDSGVTRLLKEVPMTKENQRTLRWARYFDWEFPLVVRIGRGQITPVEEHYLALQGHLAAQWLAIPAHRPLLEFFGNLGDGAHRELLEKGYLKWRYNALGPAHQEVFRKRVQANDERAKALQEAVVGFAVVDIVETQQKVVSDFVLWPDTTPPSWSTLVGLEAAGTRPYFAAHLQQLPALRARPDSTLPK